MSTKRLRSSGKWEFIVKRKGVLPKPLSLTFKTEAEGDAYVKKLEALLDRGVVPQEFLGGNDPVLTVPAAIREYRSVVAVGASDNPLLDSLSTLHEAVRLTMVDYNWVEKWVSKMKHEQHLAPGTIKHYVGALGRCLDWCVVKGVGGLQHNPIRSLKRGYATYTGADAKVAGVKRVDVERDRRISVKEETAIREAIGAYPIPEHRPFLDLMFTLAVETAMRMRETYTLTTDQINVSQKTIFLDKTKNGSKRQVPMSSVALKAIKSHMVVRATSEQRGKKRTHEPAVPDRKSLLFPWWDGDRATLTKTTFELSRVWAGVFEAAGCADLRYHDLRHEATSRFFERTTMSEFEIAKITGHKDMRSLARYANLRGSNLAAKLW